MPGWTTKVSHSLPTQKTIPSATAEKSLQHKNQLLNSSLHMQEIEQSGTANYFTFNKKIQEHPKQKPERHTRRSAHPTLFHGTFCGKIHLQYHENNNFKIYISNQFNLTSSLSPDFQEKSTFPLQCLQKERLFTQRHSCYWRKACRSCSWRCRRLFLLPAPRTTTTNGHCCSTASNLLLPYDAAVHGLLPLNVNLCWMPLVSYPGCPAAVRAALSIFVRQHKERGAGSWASQPHQSPYQNFAGFVGQSPQED